MRKFSILLSVYSIPLCVGMPAHAAVSYDYTDAMRNKTQVINEINNRIDSSTQNIVYELNKLGSGLTGKADQQITAQDKITQGAKDSAVDLERDRQAAEAAVRYRRPVMGCMTGTASAAMSSVTVVTAANAKAIGGIGKSWTTGTNGAPSAQGPALASASLVKQRQELQAKGADPVTLATDAAGKRTLSETELAAAEHAGRLMTDPTPPAASQLDPSKPGAALATANRNSRDAMVILARQPFVDHAALMAPNAVGLRDFAVAIMGSASGVTVPDKPSELEILRLESSRRWGNAQWVAARASDNPEAVQADLRDIEAYRANLDFRTYEQLLEVRKLLGLLVSFQARQGDATAQ